MPTIIDSLLVTVGLDPKDFELGVDRTQKASKRNSDVLVKQAKDIEAANTKAFQSYAKLATEFLSFVGIAAGAYEAKEFVGSVLQTNLAVGQLSTNLGIAAEDLSKWQLAVQLSGGKVEDLNGSMGSLVSTYENGIHGIMTSQVGAARALGIDFALLKSPIDFLLAVRDKLQKYDKPEQAFYANMLGIGPDTLRLLQLNNTEFQNLMDLADKNNRITDDSIAKSKEATKAIKDWNQSLNALATTLAIDILPDLTHVLDVMTKLANSKPPAWMTPKWEAPETMKRQRDETFVGGWMEWIKTGHWPQPGKDGDVEFQINPDGSPVDWSKLKSAGSGSAAGGGSNGSRADRNNNPGNLEDAQGNYRKFPNAQAGYLAMANQLLIDFNKHGQKTVESLINDPHHGWANQWAPGNSEASTSNYIRFVAKALGVDPGQKINLGDEHVLVSLMKAMNAFERGGSGVRAGISRGGLHDIPGAGQRTTEIHIATLGGITVNSQATDAKGIARELPGAIQRHTAVIEHDGGIQ